MTKQKRLAKVEIGVSVSYACGRVFWWKLVGANGQIVCTSETFERRADAKRAMRRAIAIIKGGEFKVVE